MSRPSFGDHQAPFLFHLASCFTVTLLGEPNIIDTAM
jgi:hypothetical protein